MNEPIMSRIAIILLALVMAVFGVYHFIAPQNLLAYVPSSCLTQVICGSTCPELHLSSPQLL
jgi:hypothetical protein